MPATSTPMTPRVRRRVMYDDDVRSRYYFNIPTSAHTLPGFREWSYSDSFPEHGTITFLGGEIIIDLSPERIESHGDVKSEVCRVVGNLVVTEDRGKFYLDRMRFVHEPAGISNEPEALFMSWEALIEKRIRKVPAANEKDYVEFEGTPDWVLEIVSPSSVFKDTVKLRERYHRANIPEYWLIDAREAKILFEILHHAPDSYRRSPAKRGWQYSNVFGKHFRLSRIKDRLGDSAYRLDMK